MHTIRSDVDRPPRGLVEGFEDVPVSIVSDVTGNDGTAMDSGIEPAAEGTTMAGSALTVKATPGDNLIIHRAITMAEPGDVLVIDGEGYTETAYVGELMATSCEAQGMAGMVVDGAARDRREIRGMEFPVYARAFHPRGPYKNDPGSINVRVSCGGVTVDPGDVVVGDDDGVAVLAPGDAERALEAAREKMAGEEESAARARGGEYLYEMGGYDERFDDLDVIEE